MRQRTAQRQSNKSEDSNSHLIFETTLNKKRAQARRPRINRLGPIQTIKSKFSNLSSNATPENRDFKKRNFTKITKSFSFIFLVLFLLGLFLIVYNFYKVNRFGINELNVISENEVKSDIARYIKGKAFFKVDANDFERYLKTNHPLIDKAFVNKSFVRGFLIDIKEYEPLAVLNMADGKFFLIKDGNLIPYYEIEKEIYTFRFEGNKEDLENILFIIEKGVGFMKKFEELNFYGTYTFDNFGNLSILTLDNRLIRVDLLEEYHSIDEQLKVLQNAIIKEDFLELNFRSDKLILKYKTN